MKREVSQLREALLVITGVLNRPQPDALRGVDLDRALFPVLARVERRGPLAIGELADLCGRDYTTVSRQITRLEEMGLVNRREHSEDARVTQVVITRKGRTITSALDGAREKIITSLLGGWNQKDVATLARLLRKLADEASNSYEPRSPAPKLKKSPRQRV
jgi:DNA-binding MarR family transcriptional regulator